MEKLKIVEITINSLTDDEDIRQELWVFYLEGNDLSKVTEYYEEIIGKKNGSKEEFYR